MSQPEVPNVTPKEKKRQSYTEWGKEVYNKQYEKWMPWIEDLYLRYFTKDNKASYTTKDTLGKTKVTGVEQVDTLQDGVHNLVAGQVGQGGLGQPIGDAVSKEGINRAERQGKDDKGGYAPGPAGAVVDPVVQGGQQVGNQAVEGGKALGRGVGGLFGGGGSGKQRTNPVERK